MGTQHVQDTSGATEFAKTMHLVSAWQQCNRHVIFMDDEHRWATETDSSCFLYILVLCCVGLGACFEVSQAQHANAMLVCWHHVVAVHPIL